METQYYISFLDLLGIKELAKYNPLEYFFSMEKFRNKIIKSAKHFKNDNANIKSKVHFFSDCCFIQSNDLELIFKFLAHLRKELLQDDDSLFFSASITYGKLDAVELSNNGYDKLNQNIREMIESNGVSEYLSGTIFQSDDISRVYVLQTEFKGTGIYVDDECIKKWKDSFENEVDFNEKYKKYISESFFFPSINTNTIKAYKDLKILDTENRPLYFNKLIERYYNSNAKNKKYGRFYLSLLANWVSSSNYSKIEYDNITEKLIEDSLPIVLKNLISKNLVINEIKHNAHLFEYVYFFLLKKLYEDRNCRDSVTNYFIKNIIIKNAKCKRLLSNLDEIPNAILTPEHKEFLIKEHHDLLNSL
jgi:hypothetical protein